MVKGKLSEIKTSPIYQEMQQVTTPEAPEAQEEKEEKRSYKPRKTYCKLEQDEAMNDLRSSGRKGMKLPRINMAFTPQNYDYIKTMAQATGQSLTAFINSVIDASREDNKQLYYKALEFREELNKKN